MFLGGSIVVVGLGFVILAFYFDGADEVATHDLPGGHRLIVERGREMDIAQNVYISVKGPKINHGRVYIAFVSSGADVSGLNLSYDRDAKVCWLTATSAPNSIVYIADFGNGEYWPSWSQLKDSTKEENAGNRLIAVANQKTNIYHLRDGWKSEDLISVPVPKGSGVTDH